MIYDQIIYNQIIACSQVNYVSYFDELASMIGAKPNLWKLLTTDPEMAFRCYFGPCIPAQYRLVGQGAWQGARDVIMGVEESRLFPMKTRKTVPMGQKSLNLSWMLGLFLAVISILFGLIIKLF